MDFLVTENITTTENVTLSHVCPKGWRDDDWMRSPPNPCALNEHVHYTLLSIELVFALVIFVGMFHIYTRIIDRAKIVVFHYLLLGSVGLVIAGGTLAFGLHWNMTTKIGSVTIWFFFWFGQFEMFIAQAARQLLFIEIILKAKQLQLNPSTLPYQIGIYGLFTFIHVGSFFCWIIAPVIWSEYSDLWAQIGSMMEASMHLTGIIVVSTYTRHVMNVISSHLNNTAVSRPEHQKQSMAKTQAKLKAIKGNLISACSAMGLAILVFTLISFKFKYSYFMVHCLLLLADIGVSVVMIFLSRFENKNKPSLVNKVRRSLRMLHGKEAKQTPDSAAAVATGGTQMASFQHSAGEGKSHEDEEDAHRLAELELEDRVVASTNYGLLHGRVKYKGNATVDGDTGLMVGIELDTRIPNSKRNGDKYFQCEPGKGIFVRPRMVQAEEEVLDIAD